MDDIKILNMYYVHLYYVCYFFSPSFFVYIFTYIYF